MNQEATTSKEEMLRIEEDAVQYIAKWVEGRVAYGELDVRDLALMVARHSVNSAADSLGEFIERMENGSTIWIGDTAPLRKLLALSVLAQPKIVIVTEDGSISDIVSNTPMQATLLDYDAEECDDASKIFRIPQSPIPGHPDFPPYAIAVVSDVPVLVDPKRLVELTENLELDVDETAISDEDQASGPIP